MRFYVQRSLFDRAVKATAIVKKQRMRSVQERLHDLTSLKLVPKQWSKGSSSDAQNNDQNKIKPIPVKIIEFKVADIMRAMRCDNEFEFWGKVLSVLKRDDFECHEDWFITEERWMVLEQLEKIEERIIRIDYAKEIPAIDDVLGVFFPCSRKNFTPILEPWIELFPQVIAYFSFVLDVSAQNLATVVMIHELAHAYTLAGYDINMSRGNLLCTFVPEDMAEGIAQYYTNAVCDQLDMKYSGIKDAFIKLLAGQRYPYKVFQGWTRKGVFDHESVRTAWIKYREVQANYWSEHDFRKEVEDYNQPVTKKGFWP